MRPFLRIIPHGQCWVCRTIKEKSKGKLSKKSIYKNYTHGIFGPRSRIFLQNPEQPHLQQKNKIVPHPQNVFVQTLVRLFGGGVYILFFFSYFTFFTTVSDIQFLINIYFLFLYYFFAALRTAFTMFFIQYFHRSTNPRPCGF